MTLKQEVIRALRSLPDDADDETVAERLYALYTLHALRADMAGEAANSDEGVGRRSPEYLEDDPANEMSD